MAQGELGVAPEGARDMALEAGVLGAGEFRLARPRRTFRIPAATRLRHTWLDISRLRTVLGRYIPTTN